MYFGQNLVSTHAPILEYFIPKLPLMTVARAALSTVHPDFSVQTESWYRFPNYPRLFHSTVLLLFPLFGSLASHRNLPAHQILANLEPQSSKVSYYFPRNLGGGSSTWWRSTNTRSKIQIYSSELNGDCQLRPRGTIQRFFIQLLFLPNP